MVVDDFDIRRSSLFPYKANSPLVIDANRMLPFAIGLQCFETIARRDTKILQNPCLIQQTKLSQSNVWISAGSLRLRRPVQISSASGSTKP
jgi:hypothetical protein